MQYTLKLEMPTPFEEVRQFNEVFAVPNDPNKPYPEDVVLRRIRLITEEVVDELISNLLKLSYRHVTWTADERLEMLCKITDDCVDSVVVILGTCFELGLPFDHVWQIVQRKNMEKFAKGVILDAGGKLQKPEGWTPPDDEIKAVMREHLEKTAAFAREKEETGSSFEQAAKDQMKKIQERINANAQMKRMNELAATAFAGEQSK